MSIRKYGIYLAYPPTADLLHEGLGRYLVEFLKGAQERGDVCFVIACPSWMRESLIKLFDSSGVSLNSFEIIAPASQPLSLSLHQWYLIFRSRPKQPSLWTRYLDRLKAKISKVVCYAEQGIVSSRSVFQFMLLAIFVFPLLALGLMVGLLLARLIVLMQLLLRKLNKSALSTPSLQRLRRGMLTLTNHPKQSEIINRLYKRMEESESELMRALINARTDVAAWYCPTAFWPQFNEIKAPRLMSVPDVVLTHFSTGFARIGGNRYLENFRNVEKAIEGGKCFVTYSQDVKWRTLVERYQIDPDAITVIPHGVNRLDDLVDVTGFPDKAAATKILCRNIFSVALHKAVNNGYASRLSNEFSYIFYASQFRPNKNILSLLKAYEYLLRRQYIGHKLVLTGNPNVMPEILAFINEHFLENDVLFLHGLTAQELAASYCLADLAVNPSLSEGGCPFTFTEAMSVGTPAIMARIAVTEEIISDPVMQEHMLFDPYNWKDMAERIEWGLKNLPELLEMQKPLYDRLVKRTWNNVVNDYVDVLDRISSADHR